MTGFFRKKECLGAADAVILSEQDHRRSNSYGYTKPVPHPQTRLEPEEHGRDADLRTSRDAPRAAPGRGAMPVKRMTTAAAVLTGPTERDWIDSVKDTFHHVKDLISDAGQAIKDTVNGAFGTNSGDVSQAEHSARQHVADARRTAAEDARDTAEKVRRT